MSATPYELRLEMLKMAQNYFESQLAIARDAATQSWHASVALASELKDAASLPELKMPPMYTVDDITKMAEQFNSFVSAPKPASK